VPLLDACLADIELARLAVMVSEALGADAQLGAGFLRWIRMEATLWGLTWTASFSPGIRLIVGSTRGVGHGHMAVLLEEMDWAFWRIDRDMGEVGSSQSLELGIKIGKIATLQEGIIGEVDAGHNILRTECYLFGLGKKLSTQRSKTRRPTRRTGTSSSGIILVASKTSKANPSANSSSNSCGPNSHSG
jgi:hypothetical protein